MGSKATGGPGADPSGYRRDWTIDRLPDPALAEVPDVPLGIYLHVPFCIRRCGYCAFVTYAEGEVGDPDAHARWSRAAVREVALADRVLGRDRPPLTSVFVGGGTPTMLDPAVLAPVLEAVRDRFDTVPDLEVTIEANPDGLRPGQLQALHDLGATRMSFGMQSASPRVLELLDRTHDPERAPAAVAEARAAGFGHVSLDLIYGTPGERPQDWQRTVDAALGVRRGPPQRLRPRRGGRAPSWRPGSVGASSPAPRGDEAAERYERDGRPVQRGRAATGTRSPTGPPAPVPGAGTTSCTGGTTTGGASDRVPTPTSAGSRWWNHAGLDQWQDALAAGGSPAAGHEVLTAAQRRLEGVLVGIRLAEGLDLDAADRRDALPSLVDDGLVRLDDDRVVLTRPGRLLADLVVRRLTA